MFLLPKTRTLATAAASALLASTTRTARSFTSSNSNIFAATRTTATRIMSTAATGSSSSPDAAAETTTTNDVNVASNLESVRTKIKDACERSNRSVDDVRLVAVSKIQPISKLRTAYDAGQRYFGENYVQELLEKKVQLSSSNNDDVHWHFIGALQSNKVTTIVGAFAGSSGGDKNGDNNNDDISRLTIETLSSVKLANKLNKAVEDKCGESKLLKVMVQINTSGEDTKSGVALDDNRSQVMELCRHIVTQCPNLKLQGLMTIGAPNDISCFDKLVECRDYVTKELSGGDGDGELELGLELSMGMSGDYEIAIEKGATNVRVGSTIFGERQYPPKK